MKTLLVQLAAYHLWAHQQLTDRILALPPELLEQEVAGSFPSLRRTLLHLWDAESIWWQRMKLQEHVSRPSDSFAGAGPELVRALLAQSKQWQEWVVAAQEHMFDHEFIYYDSKRNHFKQPVYLVLMQVFNHGTYHRGQLVSMLRQLGVEAIPGTDFILWSRKK